MTEFQFKNLSWRDGRPRWNPGTSTRALGFKARDLKDEHGHWLSFKAACVEASKLNASVAAKRNLTLPPARRRKQGDLLVLDSYIYFLWVGDRVKIGYSVNALKRVSGMQTALPLQFERLAIIKGSLADERRLHKRFDTQREKGEWFRTTETLNSLLFEMIRQGTTNIP